MITDNTGFKPGLSVADINRFQPQENLSRLNTEARVKGLADNEVAQGNESATGGRTAEGSPFAKDVKIWRGDKNDGAEKPRYIPFEKQKDGIRPDEILDGELQKIKFRPGGDSKLERHAKGEHDGFEKDCPACKCSACASRKYQDGSNDSSVSFQQATAMDPTAASFRVRAHEMEHVRHEQASAEREGKKIISQSVTIKTDVCPECGRVYVSGGVTRTTKQTVNSDFRKLFVPGGVKELEAAGK